MTLYPISLKTSKQVIRRLLLHVREVALAIMFLHNMGIVHGDLHVS